MLRLFIWLRTTPFFLRFTWFTRILLAAGFIPTGMVKLLGKRFTVISVESPIGAFFEAMYQTGLYWNFLGATQITAGLLLLIPACSHLGAALFLPIMVNIFVITVALGFTGTPIVTGLMVAAVLYLCFWDAHRFWSLFRARPLTPAELPPPMYLDWVERLGFQVFAVALLTFFLLSRGLASGGVGVPALVLGVAAGLVTLVRFLANSLSRK